MRRYKRYFSNIASAFPLLKHVPYFTMPRIASYHYYLGIRTINISCPVKGGGSGLLKVVDVQAKRPQILLLYDRWDVSYINTVHRLYKLYMYTTSKNNSAKTVCLVPTWTQKNLFGKKVWHSIALNLRKKYRKRSTARKAKIQYSIYSRIRNALHNIWLGKFQLQS